MNGNYEYLLVETENRIVRVTLNRPERRNALSLRLMQELTSCLRELSVLREVGAIILAGAGSAFSSGHDLNELRSRSVESHRELFEVCIELMKTIQHIPQPVIAEVQGIAMAAGCQLIATCDLAVASTEAKFATPGVRIGLFCSTPMVALVRAIGRKRALEMLLTGKGIDAQTAMEWGLVNRVVPATELRQVSETLAREIVASSPLVISIGKQAFYTQIDLDQTHAYSYAKEVMSLNSLAADAQEGISAFLEKREPCWRER